MNFLDGGPTNPSLVTGVSVLVHKVPVAPGLSQSVKIGLHKYPRTSVGYVSVLCLVRGDPFSAPGESSETGREWKDCEWGTRVLRGLDLLLLRRFGIRPRSCLPPRGGVTRRVETTEKEFGGQI